MKKGKMKPRNIIMMLFIVFTGCIWITDVSAEQDYPMVCKGGGNMSLTISDEGPKLTISFAKSPQAGSRQEPAPGTCAWVDRPINPQEPDKMYFDFGKRPKFIDIRQQNITISLNNIEDTNLRYLVDGVYNGKLFYVRCYQKQVQVQSGAVARWFVITRIGP
jgi:hypothetical protein